MRLLHVCDTPYMRIILSGFEMLERTTHVSVLLRLQYMLSMMRQGEITIHRALA